MLRPLALRARAGGGGREAQPRWVRRAGRGGGAAARARRRRRERGGRVSEGATRKESAPAAAAAAALLRRQAGERLCEAPHFNEERPRHVPALAAAAQTPALQPPPPPSPGPAAAQPPAARPRPARRGQHQEAPRARPQRPPAASLRGPVRGLPLLGKGAAGRAGWGLRRRPGSARSSRRRGRRGSAPRPAAPPAVPRKALPCRGQGGPARRVRAAPGLLAPASFVWCPRAENGESGERGPRAFRLAVSGDGEAGWRSRARCLSLSELAAERGPSLRPEGVVGPGRLLCVCFLCVPGGWCVHGGCLQGGCCKYICRVSSSFGDSQAASCTN